MFTMRFMRSAVFVCVLLALQPRPAVAQDRAVPGTPQAITLSFAPLVKKVAPAVVSIYSKIRTTQQVTPFMGDPFFQLFGGNSGIGGLTRERVENALGSGVIIDADGLVVTNAHVVNNAAEITVALTDGQEFTAQKVLVDKPSDLALLRINPGSQKLPTVNLEPSEKLQVGDLVLAIGNPFGVGQTVTSGIVSALARSALKLNDYNFFIQTDAAINPGNSGGPLINMEGNVVGINSAIFSKDGGSLGIGFAIPSEMVASLIAAEKTGQKGDHGVTRPWLGMSGQAVTHEIAESLGRSAAGGVLVSELNAASPAKKAGLQIGDVVMTVNGHAVHDPAEMKFRMAMVPLGSSADFGILRKGAEQVIHVPAMGAPDIPPRDETVMSGYTPLNGVRVANINPAVALDLGIKDESGVAVTGIEGAALHLLAPGDVIASVNRHDIKTVDDLKKTLASNDMNGWVLVISRGGQKRQIMIR